MGASKKEHIIFIGKEQQSRHHQQHSQGNACALGLLVILFPVAAHGKVAQGSGRKPQGYHVHDELYQGIDLGNCPKLGNCGMLGNVFEYKNGKQLSDAGKKHNNGYPFKHGADLAVPILSGAEGSRTARQIYGSINYLPPTS